MTYKQLYNRVRESTGLDVLTENVLQTIIENCFADVTSRGYREFNELAYTPYVEPEEGTPEEEIPPMFEDLGAGLYKIAIPNDYRKTLHVKILVDNKVYLAYRVALTDERVNSIVVGETPKRVIRSNFAYLDKDAIFYTKGNGKAEITCLTNYQGKYMLRIFGGDAGAESYPQLVEYTIESTTTADVPLGFPTIYGSYSNSDTELIEPLYTPLTRGASYNFKIRSTTYKSLYLIIGQNEFKQMNNDGNGLFTLTAKVSGSSVAVCYLEGGYYNYMLTYEVS